MYLTERIHNFVLISHTLMFHNYTKPDPNFEFTNTDWFESDIVISVLLWHTLYPVHYNRGCIADIALNSKVLESEHARLRRSARVYRIFLQQCFGLQLVAR